MGSRGRRSAADLSTPINATIDMSSPIDIAEMARQYGLSQREALRALRRAERRGEAISRISRDGTLEFFWTA
jgi:hypothetical protein